MYVYQITVYNHKAYTYSPAAVCFKNPSLLNVFYQEDYLNLCLSVSEIRKKVVAWQP
jgi:hypothetical protein